MNREKSDLMDLTEFDRFLFNYSHWLIRLVITNATSEENVSLNVQSPLLVIKLRIHQLTPSIHTHPGSFFY
jgi:hypothetical protein